MCHLLKDGSILPTRANLAGALHRRGHPHLQHMNSSGSSSAAAASGQETPNLMILTQKDDFTDETGLKLAIVGLMKVHFSKGRLLDVWLSLQILLWH